MNSFRRPIGAVIVRVSSALMAVRKVSTFRAVGVVGLLFLAVSAAACYVAALQLSRQLLPTIQRGTAELDRAAAVMRGDAPEAALDNDPAGVVARISAVVEPLNTAEEAFAHWDEAA